MIKEKIIEFVLSIPIEKWDGMNTTINGLPISFAEDAHHNATITINGYTIYPKQNNNTLHDILNKLRERKKQIEEEREKRQIEHLYTLLTCKHEKFVEMYHNSPDKELRCERCRVAKNNGA